MLTHIRAGAHGYTYVGSGECRRVIDPIACHRNDFTHVAIGFHHVALCLRQDFGPHVVDSQLLRHGSGRGPVIAGDHHNLDAFGVECVWSRWEWWS